MFHNNTYTLIDVIIEQINKTCNLSLSSNRFHCWIIFDGLVKLIVSLILYVVLQHIKNVSFFNSLLHAVQMERLIYRRTILIYGLTSEQTQCHRLRCCSKCKDRHIRRLTMMPNFIFDSVLRVCFFYTLILTECIFNRNHIFTRSRGMCLINNNGK